MYALRTLFLRTAHLKTTYYSVHLAVLLNIHERNHLLPRASDPSCWKAREQIAGLSFIKLILH